MKKLKQFALRRDAAAVVELIDCECIDELPEATVDAALRFLDDVVEGDEADADVRRQAAEMIERVTA
jgi:hypothetical protein